MEEYTRDQRHFQKQSTDFERMIAQSCACIQYAYENMLAALRQYKKKEVCHLVGVGFSGFLEENCDLVHKTEHRNFTKLLALSLDEC